MNTLFDYWMKLSLRVVLLFVTAMLVSFAPEYMREFFGDIPEENKYYSSLFFNDGWDWGFRHCLYFWMCLVLFSIQAIRIVSWAFENKDKFTV